MAFSATFVEHDETDRRGHRGERDRGSVATATAPVVQ
jgi:hypothetical protein